MTSDKTSITTSVEATQPVNLPGPARQFTQLLERGAIFTLHVRNQALCYQRNEHLCYQGKKKKNEHAKDCRCFPGGSMLRVTANLSSIMSPAAFNLHIMCGILMAYRTILQARLRQIFKTNSLSVHVLKFMKYWRRKR